MWNRVSLSVQGAQRWGGKQGRVGRRMWVKVAGWVTGWPSVWGMYQTNNLGERRSKAALWASVQKAEQLFLVKRRPSPAHPTSLRKRCFCNPTGILWRPFGAEQLCLWGINSLHLTETTHIYICTSFQFFILPAWHTLWNVKSLLVNSSLRKNTFFHEAGICCGCFFSLFVMKAPVSN